MPHPLASSRLTQTGDFENMTVKLFQKNAEDYGVLRNGTGFDDLQKIPIAFDVHGECPLKGIR
jgi:hypothetical protein